MHAWANAKASKSYKRRICRSTACANQLSRKGLFAPEDTVPIKNEDLQKNVNNLQCIFLRTVGDAGPYKMPPKSARKQTAKQEFIFILNGFFEAVIGFVKKSSEEQVL